MSRWNQFPEQIFIFLDGSTNVGLSNRQQVERFSRSEREQWLNIERRVRASSAADAWNDDLHMGWKALENVLALESAGRAEESYGELVAVVDAFNLGVLVGSASTRGKLIRSSLDQANMETLRLALGENDPPGLPWPEAAGWSVASLGPDTKALKLLPRTAALMENLTVLDETTRETLEKYREFEQKFPAIFDMVENLQTNAESIIENIKSKYLAEQELKEAQSYWEKRAVDHKIAARWHMAGFLCLVLLGTVTIPLSFVIAAKFGLVDSGQPSNWPHLFFLFGVPALFLVWLTRTEGKLFNHVRSLRTDAEERLTLMRTYIAMNAQGDLSSDDKHLIMKALYRSTISPDIDEPPPSWFDALLEHAGRLKAP